MRCYKNIITLFTAGLLASLFYSSKVCAAPSGADLESACQQSLEYGFHGNEGMLCTWYVTPCDCDYGMKQEFPRVCLPETVPVETLAGLVVNGLKKQPELKTEDAGFAAAEILSRTYPCSE